MKHVEQRDWNSGYLNVFFFILDEINVQSEEIVFEAFLSWINYDFKRQTDRLAQLFGLIKLPLIDKKVCHRSSSLNRIFFYLNSILLIVLIQMKDLKMILHVRCLL